MTRSLVPGVVLGAAVLAVAGAAWGSGTAWPKPDARDRALLASVLRGMTTDPRRVRLTRLQAEWRKGRSRGTLELVVVGAVIATHVRSIRLRWETLLIAHAYNERCVRNADHCVAVYREADIGAGGAGRSGAKRPYWSARDLTRGIRSQFTAAGLPVNTIAFEQPNAFAPIITVRTSHPRRAYAAEGKAWVALMPTLRRHAEGAFIQMFDARGRLFYVSAGSGNTGMSWCAPFLKCPAP